MLLLEKAAWSHTAEMQKTENKSARCFVSKISLPKKEQHHFGELLGVKCKSMPLP